MNDESGSLQPETLLIIVCVVGVFIAALFFAIRSGAKRASLMRDFARSRGWTYSRADTQGLSLKVDDLFPDQQFRLDNVMTVEAGARSLFLFDCGYHYRDKPRGGGSFGTGCLIESTKFRIVGSRTEIVARNWIDAALLPDQVDMGDAEFSRNFIVLSKDPMAAQQVVTGALQEALVAHRQSPLFNPVRIGLNAGGAVLLTGLTAEPERWTDLVELARRIEASLP
jgi:hypothetical protein